jgi:hypothetical protein
MDIKIGAPATGKDFFPRDHITEQLLNALRIEPVLFLAPRRTGKTSVVLHLLENAPAHCVFINLEKCNHPKLWINAMVKELRKIQDHAWLHKLKTAGDFLERLDSEVLNLREADWNDAAERLMDGLERLQAPVWFLLDEFPTMVDLIARKHGADEADAAVRWLRACLQENTNSPVRFLLTGSIGLDNVLRRHRIRGPGNDLRRITLPPMAHDEALKLALTLAHDNHIPLNKTLAEEYLQRLGPAVWPYFIQLFVAELQDAAASPDAPADLQQIYRRVAQGKRNQYSENMWTRLADIFDEPLDSNARAILKRVAASETGIPSAELRSRTTQLEDDDYQYVLEVLQHDGYLIEADNGNIQFFSHLLRDYWRWKGRV